MDSLGALALATEPPSPRLMDRVPPGRSEYLISPPMIRHIVVHAAGQLAVLFVLLYAAPWMFGYAAATGSNTVRRTSTIVFNTFVFAQFFNEINSRKVNDGLAFLPASSRPTAEASNSIPNLFLVRVPLRKGIRTISTEMHTQLDGACKPRWVAHAARTFCARIPSEGANKPSRRTAWAAETCA